MIHKNTFLFALVLINLFFLIYIVSNDSQESNVIYSSNIDIEKINKLESSFKDIYSAINDIKSSINDLEQISQQNKFSNEKSLPVEIKPVQTQFEPYEISSQLVAPATSNQILNNQPNEYLSDDYFKSRQAAFELLNETDIFDEDSDIDEDN